MNIVILDELGYHCVKEGGGDGGNEAYSKFYKWSIIIKYKRKFMEMIVDN